MLPAAYGILRSLPGLAPLFEGSPTVTPTVGIEATPTPLPAQPTPEPTPFVSPWTPDRWFQTTGWTTDFHTPFLVLFLFVAIAAVIVYFALAQKVFKGHALKARLAERTSLILTLFATAGLLFLFFAMARVALLSFPIWLILTMVAFIAFIIYAVYYYVAFYPLALARYQREQERLRYMPKPKTKPPSYIPKKKRKK